MILTGILISITSCTMILYIWTEGYRSFANIENLILYTFIIVFLTFLTIDILVIVNKSIQ